MRRRGNFVEEFKPGKVHHLRGVPAGGDNRTLRIYRVADDFGAEEFANLAPAKLLEGDLEEETGSVEEE